MSIFTNRLKIDFHIDAIKQDFVFIRLKRDNNEGKWWGAEELDRIIGENYQAMSVGYAQYAYAMFAKKINNTYELVQKLKSDPDFADVCPIPVEPQAFYNGNEECISEVTLARLLLNSLGSSRSRFNQLHFSNLTGALLKVPSLTNKLKDVISVAEISLSRDDKQQNQFLLNVSLASFRKKISILAEYKGKQELKKILKQPQYVFHSGTGSLRRWLTSEGKEPDSKETYIKKGKTGTKVHTDFLNFRSQKDFDNSRAGIIYEVFQSIQEHLSEYMSVEFCSLEVDDTVELKTTVLKNPKELHSQLQQQKIHIVDRVNDEDSADLVSELKKGLIPYITDEKLITTGKQDKKDAFNFRIIHNAEFYEKIEQKDEYLASNDTIQRQNLTIESTREFSESVIKTIIKEQLIKRDISKRKLNLFDWEKLQLNGVWTFAAWDDEENHVIFMEIQPNGDFQLHRIEGIDIFNCDKFQKYQHLMRDSKSGKKRKNLEGLVISDSGDINQIFLTDEITIPKLSQIAAIIEEVENKFPENLQTGRALAGLIKSFISEIWGKNDENLVKFVDELEILGNDELDKNRFKQLLNQHLGKNSNIASELREYLLDKHQIRLIFSKEKSNLEYLYDASLNIKYFGQTEKEAYYFVGDRREKIKYSFKDACHLRRIVAVENSKLIFRQLLPTMDVDFVRTGQSTVIPFPFKYIREYQNFE
ncbi:hypothetical protein [Nodularia sphaerocarpa]|uniref:hypothetical protein n=1 Tax=Nodularia sphaerocarpa TaxID=137816 RepID=UPI001EFAC1CB|nr:hypothetical protein [Nodularia sphaerocarpa]MDB9372854.1 hypothetical protein [Nodularia sphaerocarpa CS-585]MDB9378477.1 hypothetical protein [Nodularia sphaerocarpa CS-585A2]ULP71062.1 hypothetical protein BDGGKGIB_00684 [Nodularia sphaerocarpa UHCC 0038]